MKTELYQQTCHELIKKVRAREISCEDIVKSIYGRINELERTIKGYIQVEKMEKALAQSKIIDGKHAKGEQIGLLAGIPIAVKDNICTKDFKTTCGSRMLENFVPIFDATVIEKIKEQDAIIIGKTNMDEFAMGSSTENSFFGPTRNPWDFERVPGGTSGGSAAVVASDETILALGSDTGGSIRQPASFCNVVGFKPTYGRVSRYGLISYASSLDQIGVLTRDVRDAATLMNIICGYDRHDSTSVKVDVPDYTRELIPDISGLRIGIPREYFDAKLDDNVKTVMLRSIKMLSDMGATCEEMSLPHTKYAVPVYYIIATAEASSNLARYSGVHFGFRSSMDSDWDGMYLQNRAEGFGREVKRRILLGTFVLSSGYYEAYYMKAQKVRTLICRDFENAFSAFDVILTPVSPFPAFKIGEKTEDPLSMYLSDIYSVTANLAGLPAICLPGGFTEQERLPVGIQFTGNPFHEEMLFKIAYTFETATEYFKIRPTIERTNYNKNG